MIGKTLGYYQITGQLGKGGMGVVYRARDPRVGREVAIKISAEKFSDQVERDARAIAALIIPIFVHCTTSSQITSSWNWLKERPWRIE